MSAFIEYEPEPKCETRRGGPRSLVTCELPLDHERSEACEAFHSEHLGRGRFGQWFSWRVVPSGKPGQENAK